METPFLTDSPMGMTASDRSGLGHQVEGGLGNRALLFVVFGFHGKP
jgi:hypothetical protein